MGAKGGVGVDTNMNRLVVGEAVSPYLSMVAARWGHDFI